MPAREPPHRLVDKLRDEEAAEALEQLAHGAGVGWRPGTSTARSLAAQREDRAALRRANAEIDAGDYASDKELREWLEALRRAGG